MNGAIKNFQEFLKSQGASKATIKNYLADIRHFLGWLKFTLKSRQVPFEEHSPLSLVQKLNKELIISYKKFLLSNKVATKTINRRLSGLRKFCKFCISQRWLSENPAKRISNISKRVKEPWEKILKNFAHFLQEGGAQKATIKNYIADIRQFLNWVESVT